MDGVSRRGFLGAMFALGAAPAIVRAESLMRVRAIVLPGEAEFEAVAVGNRFISPEMFAREALKILETNLRLMENMNRTYEAEWKPTKRTIQIRRPLIKGAVYA